MAGTREQICDRVDRILIEGCASAEEVICAKPADFQERYYGLSECCRCALTFIRQWSADVQLPITLKDLDTVLILRFSRINPFGDHVHERILEELDHLGSQAGNDADESVEERDALIRIKNALAPANRELISATVQTAFEVLILLSGDPDEESARTAVFKLAKLLDPDLEA